MRRILAVIAAMTPLLASAGVKRVVQIPEALLWTSYRSSTMTAGGTLGGTCLPARGFTVTGSAFHFNVNGGGGAGNTVVRITDGTNNCDLTISCAATGSGAPKSLRATASGTCTFPPNACLSGTVQTAGCTTTQPSVINWNVLGLWN